MPETMSPREKVAAAINEFVFQAHNGRLSGVDLATDAILAALASSGDHAELARLAEWRDRLRADPGRAAHFGSPYADKPMHNGRTYWNSDLAEDITTLIAEVAALRAKNDVLEIDRLGLRSAIFGSHDYDPSLRHGNFIEMARTTEEARQGALVRATEAERKLAEAVGLLAQARSWAPTTGPLGDKISTFLSKEAERG